MAADSGGAGETAESARMADPAGGWDLWGPYLAERAWGSVREDYSPDGNAWRYLPHDRARSAVYRWNEDGLAGISDLQQRLCLGLGLWNGADPFLKERCFGLANGEGNHGEDVKEYWWYLDAVPSHAWLRWRYHYPQRAFPYERLREVAAERRTGGNQFEPELLDVGAFDEDRYWVVQVDYAKAARDDVLMRVRATNAGPEAAVLHVLPTLWFRNTWTWEPGSPVPVLEYRDGAVDATHPTLGDYRLHASGTPDMLFCDNEPGARYPKDGINDHVVGGAGTVNPGRRGTKAACWYRLTAAPGETVEVRLRLSTGDDPWTGFDDVVARREREADEYYAALTPAGASAAEAAVLRQAFASLLWSKQYYPYDVNRWLDGDPGEPPPPAERQHGRNAGWRHFAAADVMSMPDTWEYPWFAAWDLAFHTVALAHLDPGYAKGQLRLLCTPRFQHPDGNLPAYEWDFGDLNPPVHAWAAMKVYRLDGSRDRDFLREVYRRLELDYGWWSGHQDRDGNRLFEGGFLGLDNISPFNRSHLPDGVVLEQADATAWMAFYTLAMLHVAIELGDRDPSYDEHVHRYLENFNTIAQALATQGLWDPQDGFFYDRVRWSGGQRLVKVHSVVGVLPLCAALTVPDRLIEHPGAANFRAAVSGWTDPRRLGSLHRGRQPGHSLLSLVSKQQLVEVLSEILDTEGFLSPYGIRSLSRRHRSAPSDPIDIDGTSYSVGYEPAEADAGGTNSNWRGPVWFPVNYLLIEALGRLGRYYGDEVRVEFPTGSGTALPLDEVAEELGRRLVALFLPEADGRRPAYGWVERFTHDERWRDNITFFEYFHADNGAGLGASHQTGWTALVADLITARRPGIRGD
jgi:hypothetical protein